jgi:hypothetical protein
MNENEKKNQIKLSFRIPMKSFFTFLKHRRDKREGKNRIRMGRRENKSIAKS